MAALDFPASPTNGQVFTGVGGINWVWDGAKWTPGNAASGGQFLPLAGGTMTGPIALSGLPTAGNQAASKAYVDGFLPLAGGTLTGPLTIQGTSAFLNLQKPTGGAGVSNAVLGYTGPNLRWVMFIGDGAAEGGANAGSNLVISRYNDAGSVIDTPLSINRATGQTSFGGVLVNPSGAINITSTATGVVDQVMMNAIANAASDCFIRTTGNRIWAFGVKGTTSAGSFMIADLSAPASRITINPGGAIILDAAMVAPGSGVVASNCGFLSTGGGQTGGWDPLNGSKAACISLIDSGGAAGSGGAVEFGANGGGWKFAAIKGHATNGANFGVGEIRFYTRNVTTDGFLTNKGVLANDGVWYNTNASWSAISDRAMKENIVPYSNGLAAIIGLEPIEFDYIADSPFGSGETRHIGLIAQDAEAYIPECVGSMEIDQMTDDPKSIATLNTGPLLYTLINAVKELASRLEALETAGSA